MSNKSTNNTVNAQDIEPVAWIKQGRLGYPVLEFNKPFRYESYAIQNQPIPLYLHPADLTDEEIEKIEHRVYLSTIAKGKSLGSYSKALIKAILKKAQEK